MSWQMTERDWIVAQAGNRDTVAYVLWADEHLDWASMSEAAEARLREEYAQILAAAEACGTMDSIRIRDAVAKHFAEPA